MPERAPQPVSPGVTSSHIAAGLVIVLEHWGAPAGFVVVTPREDGSAELAGPFIEPDLWRSGMGRKLAEEAVSFAAALEASALVAMASPQAEGFYARIGFVREGERATPHGLLAVMARSLLF